MSALFLELAFETPLPLSKEPQASQELETSSWEILSSLSKDDPESVEAAQASDDDAKAAESEANGMLTMDKCVELYFKSARIDGKFTPPPGHSK